MAMAPCDGLKLTQGDLSLLGGLLQYPAFCPEELAPRVEWIPDALSSLLDSPLHLTSRNKWFSALGVVFQRDDDMSVRART
jgi:hypothetical protein